MKTINYAYILLGITIFIMFVAIIVNWNDNDIEKLRADKLDLYSNQLQWVQIDIQRKEKQVEVIKEQITELKGVEDWLISCLKLNSQEWIVTDCNLYFNWNKDE